LADVVIERRGGNADSPKAESGKREKGGSGLEGKTGPADL